jgi:terminase small subunit-like protein
VSKGNGKICTVDGCSKPSHARGLCSMHRQRQRRHGDSSAPVPARKYSPYSPELAEEICGLTVEGNSLRAIEKMPGMPSLRGMLKWFCDYPEFRENYEMALKKMAVSLGVELLHIYRKDGEYYSITEDGRPVFDYARARVASDNIKWFLARILHGTYGDRVQHTGKDGGPVQFQIIDAPVKESRDEWLARQMDASAGTTAGGDPGKLVH